MALRFNPDYKSWKEKYENEPVYTEKQFRDALKEQEKSFVINRVIQSFSSRVGPNESVAMQILAIHKTPEGITIIVK